MICRKTEVKEVKGCVMMMALTDWGGGADECGVDRGRGEAADDARRFHSVAAHLLKQNTQP